jgi:AcrR family transcriptional regulator
VSRGTRRLSAEERRIQVVDAAIEEFADAGLAGTSTEAVARRAGISHAYLFRLYPTRRELFLAAIDEAFGRVLRTFQAAAASRPADVSPFAALGASYVGLIEDRHELQFGFHAYAACGDEDIRARVRERYLEIFDFVREATGRPDDEIRLFMATGALLSIGGALETPELAGDGSWMGRLLRARHG